MITKLKQEIEGMLVRDHENWPENVNAARDLLYDYDKHMEMGERYGETDGTAEGPSSTDWACFDMHTQALLDRFVRLVSYQTEEN